ncbi:MAG TPA: aspartate--tRNA ligase [Acidimicrobiales bacterium]|jgi:aspartyl-tRNA synthetase|nr:aspartate--tRNA ligase [Acidimicrobiales bacterium]
MMRTHYAGELRPEHLGRNVRVCGWVASRREHGEHLAFVDVRDHTGVIQCVVPGAHQIRSEYVVCVSGTVRARPEGTLNPNLPTGEVELGDCTVEVLSEAEPPPFPVHDRVDADENLRLRYRYVDLRRPSMQRNLRLRAAVSSAIRRSMEAEGFVEVETPTLIASTPEGARDFVVPARLQPGSFYALPQSPQLFKQLLMVGGVDRYFQLARCLRDEDLRADRQFEFTQLDAEMSFADQDDVIAVMSRAVVEAIAAAGRSPVESPIPQMTWREAQDRFGSDKPDVRFDMELVELTEVVAGTGFRAFEAPCVKGIRVPGEAGMGRAHIDRLTDLAKASGAGGLVWLRMEGETLASPILKFLSEEEQSSLPKALGAEPDDLLLIVAGARPVVDRVLGQLRLELGRPPVTEGGLNLLWVTEFPLFEGLDADGRPVPAHHPFTMPHPEDLDRLDTDPLSVRSQAYDLVLNGWELGSGSVRIHRPDIQQRIFSFLGIEPEQAQARFGFLLDAFRHGAPPHAGFAFGIDRLVALLAGEENIREVIAFPKTQSGVDPLTGAPNPIDPRQLSELGLRLLPPPT